MGVFSEFVLTCPCGAKLSTEFNANDSFARAHLERLARDFNSTHKGHTAKDGPGFTKKE